MGDEAEKAKKRISRLEQKFNSLERLVKALETCLGEESPNLGVVEMRVTALTTLYNECVHNHEELSSLKNDHPSVAKFDALETRYFKVAAKALELKTPAFDPLANSTSLNNTVTFTERVDVPKLAAIPIPKFDGNQDSWVTWKAGFKALIHDRPGMADSVKLSQLGGAVEGLGRLVINEFCNNPVEGNYALAWEALCKAYDQRRVIINEHFDALLNLSPALKPTAETTARLMYTVRQHVSMLNAMKITVGDEFVIRILERCLPAGILSRWIERLSTSEYPKLEDLYTFVQNSIFRQREMDNVSQRSLSSKRAANSSATPPSKVTKFSTRSLFTASESTNNPCPQCDQSHRLYKCDAFNASKLKDRWNLVRDKKLCRNCLYTHSSPCTSAKRCKKCQRDHDTLLHTDKKPQNSNAPNSQFVKEASSSGSSQK